MVQYQHILGMYRQCPLHKGHQSDFPPCEGDTLCRRKSDAVSCAAGAVFVRKTSLQFYISPRTSLFGCLHVRNEIPRMLHQP
jgi:hypothetical protein